MHCKAIPFDKIPTWTRLRLSEIGLGDAIAFNILHPLPPRVLSGSRRFHIARAPRNRAHKKKACVVSAQTPISPPHGKLLRHELELDSSENSDYGQVRFVGVPFRSHPLSEFLEYARINRRSAQHPTRKRSGDSRAHDVLA